MWESVFLISIFPMPVLVCAPGDAEWRGFSNSSALAGRIRRAASVALLAIFSLPGCKISESNRMVSGL
jgi:hypothetical protein